MFLFHLCMAVELGERRGAVCVLLTKEGEREGGWLRRQGGGAVAGRGMARPLHDDDDDAGGAAMNSTGFLMRK